ncbi:uncharacterized protein FPRO_05795 [Fusarium proliferatum ET1]|uniref:Uncharacterized protein n=1 Tax=Fusarium proliferatum (strain ET1) TaxID=1227346 RepID=A0A1L7VEA5_FUSPR|nr:uncharacterized protein FPRO_05795 [Fusarium proliferatum ET1]CZR39013.1 uncharacterized protein FPRO_05795 [Fusarium proliferatum ET1]
MARDSLDGTSHPLFMTDMAETLPLIRVGEKLQVKAAAVSVD